MVIALPDHHEHSGNVQKGLWREVSVAVNELVCDVVSTSLGELKSRQVSLSGLEGHDLGVQSAHRPAHHLKGERA